MTTETQTLTPQQAAEAAKSATSQISGIIEDLNDLQSGLQELLAPGRLPAVHDFQDRDGKASIERLKDTTGEALVALESAMFELDLEDAAFTPDPEYAPEPDTDGDALKSAGLTILASQQGDARDIERAKSS